MKILRWFAALSVSAAGLWFALRGADWRAMGETLGNLRSPWVLALIPAACAAEYFLRTLRWRLLLAPLRRVSTGEFYPVTVAAFFLNNVLPFRAGEFARIYWTGRKARLPLTSCFSVLAVDRVFDMLSILALAGLVAFRKSHLFPSPRPVLIFAVVAVAGVFVFLGMAWFPGPFLRAARRSWAPAWAGEKIRSFIAGAAALRGPAVLAAVLAVSLVFWAMNVTLFQIVARVFSLPLSWVDAAWLTVAFCFGAMLPSAPGYVGTLEAAGVAALGLLGHDRGISLPFILVLHFAQILSTALLGVPSLWLAGLTAPRWDAAGAVSAAPAAEVDQEAHSSAG